MVVLVWFFWGYRAGFFPYSCFEFQKTFASHLSSEYSKVTLQGELFATVIWKRSWGLLVFSEQIQVPPPCLGSPCVRSGPSLSFLLLQHFIPFWQGIREQDTRNNNLVCLVLQFYFCRIDSWYCSWFTSLHYWPDNIFCGQSLLSVP